MKYYWTKVGPNYTVFSLSGVTVTSYSTKEMATAKVKDLNKEGK